MIELFGALIGTAVMAGLIALAYARYRWAPSPA